MTNASKVDADKIRQIAKLARIGIDEADIPGYVQSISDILELVGQMNQVNTDHITPMAHPQDLVQREREDEVTEQDQHQHFQQSAPQVEADMYIVPQVIE